MTGTSSVTRRAWLAAIGNLAVPGLGALYAGAPAVALAWFLLPLAGVAVLGIVALTFRVRPVNVLLFWAGWLFLIVGTLRAGWVAARRASKPFRPKRYNRPWVYILHAILVLGVFGILLDGWIRPRLFEAFRNPSSSMEPGLQIGDYFYVAKTPGRPPRLGSLVAFSSVEEPGLRVLKRVVGLGGDTIAMIEASLVRNGRRVAEPYTAPPVEWVPDTVSRRQMRALRDRLAPGDTSDWTPHSWGPLVVPAGTMFVLGDNRDESYDSRYYGTVPVLNVIGEPRMIYLSLGPNGIRWRRLGLFPSD